MDCLVLHRAHGHPSIVIEAVIVGGGGEYHGPKKDGQDHRLLQRAQIGVVLGQNALQLVDHVTAVVIDTARKLHALAEGPVEGFRFLRCSGGLDQRLYQGRSFGEPILGHQLDGQLQQFLGMGR